MNEALEFIIDIIWLLDLAGLLAFGIIAKKQGRINSSLVSVVVVVAFAGIMLAYQVLLQHFDLQGPSALILFLWYIGFTLFYILLIMALRWAHVILQLPIGSIGKFYTNIATVLGIITLLQYSEIIIFKTDTFFDLIYSTGIPLINITASMIVACMGIQALYFIATAKGSRLERQWTL